MGLTVSIIFFLHRIELNNAAELEGLMKIKEYETYLGTLADDH